MCQNLEAPGAAWQQEAIESGGSAQRRQRARPVMCCLGRQRCPAVHTALMPHSRAPTTLHSSLQASQPALARNTVGPLPTCRLAGPGISIEGVTLWHCSSDRCHTRCITTGAARRSPFGPAPVVAAATQAPCPMPAEPAPPVLLLLKGHPGSGKSTLAAALAAALRWPVVDKDDARSPMQQLATTHPGIDWCAAAACQPCLHV